MATRKAASAGDGNKADASRPASGKQGAGGAAGGSGAGATKGAARKTSGATNTGGAAKSAGGAAKKGGARKSAGGGKPDLRADLRQFVDENPEGWGHDQWQGLLGRLGERGHDTSDPDRIGMELERERVSARLERVEGVNSRQAKTIADRFGTLYSLRNASAEEIERLTKVPRKVAERIKNTLG